MAKKKAKKEKAPKVDRPKQARLPEMQDNQIEELESAALDYAAIRDQRQQLTAKEVPLKQQLLTAMKKHGKMEYLRDGIKIVRTVEKEGVKVRIKKYQDEE